MPYFNDSFPLSEYDADQVYRDSADMGRHHYKMFLNQYYETQDLKFRLSEIEKGGVNKPDLKEAILQNGFGELMEEMMKQKLERVQSLLMMADNNLTITKNELKVAQNENAVMFEKMYARFVDLLASFNIALLPNLLRVEEDNGFVFGFANGKWSMMDIDKETLKNYYTRTAEDTYEKVASKITDTTKGLMKEVIDIRNKMQGGPVAGDVVDDLPF